ncbi:cysteine proteinase [Mollisia scopiformis]|uniref:Cysteine proteinase n=1 Tax=Mollisia scopiformis TaxID=149040 RepID=A0A194X0L4_MOLSC|nr:cysteine proteinase [Mollisia scopiformis]KUJ13736.1 cysteine proteinase [Mollisia scopiformis]
MIPHRFRPRGPGPKQQQQQPRDARSEAGSAVSGRSGPDQAKDVPMVLIPQPPAKKPKKIAPQAAIDEFWAKFNSKTPGIAETVLPKNVYAKKAREQQPKGTIRPEPAVKSYEEAAQNCKDKVAKIVKECRRVNQKYRDPHFDIEFDLKWGKKDCLTMLSGKKDDVDDDDDDSMWNFDFGFSPGSVKRVGDIFEDPKFYIGGANANDIRQGRDGDCWFMAALCTLGNKADLIPKVCVARDEQVGVYGFVFHRDGEWVSEIIDDKLYLTKPDYDESWIERNLIEDRQRINSEEDYRKIYQSGSGALYFAQCEDPNETWLPLLEKAYAKAHGDYAAIEGGSTGEGLEDLTGGVTTEIFSTDILDKEYFWNEELMNVNKDFLFGCAAGIFWGRGNRKGIYEGHAYSILKAVEMDGQRLVLVRNPWGEGEWHGPWSDGSKEWTPEWMQKLDHRFGDDGAFWMSYDDLLKKYETFDRTRLFNDEWKVTQQWTSLQVPWTVGYQDTEFHFTLENAASVVIVLSQLDQRYFCGLEGQYNFELSFRVHKAGEEDYIVRSHGNYWMRRSVTAELDLEAGEYHVLMKVEAEKNDYGYSVEDVIRSNAKDRRDKLMRIGLAYDMAMAKGKVVETEDEKKARKAYEAKKKAKAKKEMKEKLMKEKKKRRHVENRDLRKQRAANAKRKEKEKARMEKRKAKEAEEAKKDEAKDEKKEEKKEDVQAEIAEEIKKQDETTESATEVKSEVKDEPKPEIKDEPKPEVKEEAKEESKPEVKEEPKETPKEDTKPSDPTPPATETKPTPDQPAPPTDIPTSDPNAPLPPLPPPPPFDDFDDDDLSDLNSVVSDISSSAVSDAILDAKLAADASLPPPLPPNDDDEDEFERDPWNAVAVVGLRVYCKGSGVTVKVCRPREWEEGEGKLDLDDSAADATKDVVEKVEEEKREESKVAKGEGDEKKSEGESEGSVVVV